MKILLIAMALLFSGAAYDSNPMGAKGRDDYWVCSVVGHTDGSDEKLLPLSGVFTSPNSDVEKMEDAFETEANEALGGNFVSDFPPRCMDFDSVERAQKNREHQRRLANEHGYKVVDIDFKY